MEVVNIEELRNYPKNTMYAVIKENEGDNYFINPRIIIDSSNGWFNGVQFLLPEVFEDSSTGEIRYSWGIIDESSVDFENNEKFIVFEREDLEEIQNILSRALKQCSPDCQAPGN